MEVAVTGQVYGMRVGVCERVTQSLSRRVRAGQGGLAADQGGLQSRTGQRAVRIGQDRHSLFLAIDPRIP